jgi:hypothetical protein
VRAAALYSRISSIFSGGISQIIAPPRIVTEKYFADCGRSAIKESVTIFNEDQQAIWNAIQAITAEEIVQTAHAVCGTFGDAA